ncbi:MAG: Crp/Fnr family transcriptional regulator [Flavobacteriales bacterium]|nr:Crp/Fnr family transcriptional regulator [Flavobacteriales bacterium]
MIDYGVLNNIFSEEHFSKEELETILSKFTKLSYSKGENLLEINRNSNHYWYIEEGLVRSYLIDYEGNEVCTGFSAKGDIIIDWPSFFMRTPTKETIEALSDCICWQLDFETFQQLFHSVENFRESGRARLVQSYFELKAHSTSLITDLAKDRYLNLLSTKKEIAQKVPLKMLASYLGITDSSLSRIRKEIARGK